MSRFKSREFKALEQEWYKKLKDEGFKDIENSKLTDRPLKEWHCSYFQTKHEPEAFEFKGEYYRLAGSYLEARFDQFQLELFDKKPEAAIWELHSQGVSVRKIGEQLGIHYLQVHFVVRRLVVLMKKARHE